MKPEDIVVEIIKEQSQIVGEYLAKHVAANSGVVKFNSTGINDISLIGGEPDKSIQKLVDSYKGLFGQASVQVCLDVINKYSH